MRTATALTALTLALAAGTALSAGASSASSSCTTVIRGTSASETLAARAGTRLLGMEGHDRITGSAGGDCIDGGPGNDRIAGRGGPDKLEGALGNDVLTGSGGADELDGGPGADKLAGGGGADRLSDTPARYEPGALAAKRTRAAAGPGADRIEVANGHRDLVNCGPGRDVAFADREDRLLGCERRRFLRSPVPEAAPRSGGRGRTFMVRFRALEEVASRDEHFSISVQGPAGCGRILTSSAGIRYRAGATVRYRMRPFGAGGRSAKRWCRGRYRGSVEFVRGSEAGVRVGAFTFRVR